jgi:glycogen(starch) synthase
MRILHLSSLYAPFAFGGAERVVQSLAEKCAAKGHTVAVAHLAPKPMANNVRNGVEVYPLRHRNPLWIEESAKYPAPVRMLNKACTIININTTHDIGAVIDRFDPDIVHSHSMVELSPLAWAQAREKRRKLVHTLHDYDLMCLRAALFKGGTRCEPRHLTCRISSRFKRGFHHRIDHVVGVSDAILQRHLADGLFAHLPAERRSVIWNPVPPATVTAPRPPKSETGITFGFLGRLVPEKGIELLLEACKGLPAAGWRLLVAGRAPASDARFRTLAGQMPVSFVGYVNPSEFLAGLDVLIAPSIWEEPFGLGVIEGYRAGIPVLGARIGGIAELIRGVDPDWLFTAGDAADLQRKMEDLLHRRRPLVIPADAVSRLLEQVSDEVVADRYLQVYQTLAADR